MFLDEIIYVVGVDLMLECICLMGYGQFEKVFEIVVEMCFWNGYKVGLNIGCGVVYGFSFGVLVVIVV